MPIYYSKRAKRRNRWHDRPNPAPSFSDRVKELRSDILKLLANQEIPAIVRAYFNPVSIPKLGITLPRPDGENRSIGEILSAQIRTTAIEIEHELQSQELGEYLQSTFQRRIAERDIEQLRRRLSHPNLMQEYEAFNSFSSSPEPDRRMLLVLSPSQQDFRQWWEYNNHRFPHRVIKPLRSLIQLIGRSSENTQLIRLEGWEYSEFFNADSSIEYLNARFPEWQDSPIEPIPGNVVSSQCWHITGEQCSYRVGAQIRDPAADIAQRNARLVAPNSAIVRTGRTEIRIPIIHHDLHPGMSLSPGSTITVVLLVNYHDGWNIHPNHLENQRQGIIIPCNVISYCKWHIPGVLEHGWQRVTIELTILTNLSYPDGTIAFEARNDRAIELHDRTRYTAPPTPHFKPRPQPCIDCTNYHGQSYSGNMLICAIHPHGWQTDDNCPDKETSSAAHP